MQFKARDHRYALSSLVETAQERAWIVAPFVTRAGLDALASALRRHLDVRLITRLTRRDMAMGSLDAGAIADAMENGLRVRFARADLHAKLWVVDDEAAIGSANLTAGGLDSNLELMVHGSADGFTMTPDTWFENFWDDLGPGREVSVAVLRSEAARAASNPLTLPPAEDIAPLPFPSEAVRDRPAWLLLGKNTERQREDQRIGKLYADFHGGWGFSKGNGRPRLAEGDQVFILEASETGTRKNDWSVVARAQVAVPYTPGVGDLPPWLLDELTELGRDRAERWGGYIIWLRNLQAIATTYADAPSAFDLIPRFKATQNGRRRASPAQADTLNAELDSVFSRVGSKQSEEPSMWWALFAKDKRRRYTLNEVRSRL